GCGRCPRSPRAWISCALPWDTCLFPDRTPRAFAGARVGAGALTAHRQPAPVAHAAVDAEIHQPLDVHRVLATQVAFDGELADFVAQRIEPVFGQVLDLRRRVHAHRLAELARGGAADAVDVRQGDACVLVVWDVDPGDTCHANCSVLPCAQPCRCLCRGSASQITLTTP